MDIPFLTARWRNLLVINYQVDPAVLAPLLPPGTELDLFEDKALVSVIAFRFEDNKLFGVLPTHPVRDFEELNLRFYVRRVVSGEVRRGVVFVKEVVPSALIAGTARLLYNEPYEARPMSHSFSTFSDQDGGELSYEVTVGLETVTVSATTCGEPQKLAPHSVEEFTLEHYWGYTRQQDGSTSEYRVSHQPWSYWETLNVSIQGELSALYPASLKPYLEVSPHSSFVATGSSVSVFAYRRFNPSCDPAVFPRTDIVGYVLYDDSCGFCSWLARRSEQLLTHGGFAIAPLQDDWVRQAMNLPEEELLRHIRIALPDGTTVTGADAYIYAMRRLPWLKPLGALLSLPGFRWIAWMVYRVINRNRFAISRVCPPKSKPTR